MRARERDTSWGATQDLASSSDTKRNDNVHGTRGEEQVGGRTDELIAVVGAKKDSLRTTHSSSSSKTPAATQQAN